MNFFSFFLKKKVPTRTTIRSLITAPLSWLGVVLIGLLIAIAVMIYILLIKLNDRIMVTIPAHGGTLTEGVIGAPHLINPILAQTETDVELATLMYVGLVAENADGSFSPVLADHYEISPDNRTYTFTLRKKLQFHDKKPLTSADVAYTFGKVANTTINPGGADYWHNITVSTSDTSTISFTLPEPRNDFLAHATVGILPAHIWQDVPDELFDTAPENTAPVGAGAFAFKKLVEHDGIPEEIILSHNAHFALGKPYLDELRIAFYANQQDLTAAIEAGDADFSFALQSSSAATLAVEGFDVEQISTGDTIGLFGLDGSSHLDASVLKILNSSIDMAHILAIVEHGYGIAPSILGDTPDTETTLASLTTIGYTQQDGTLQKKGIPVSTSIAVENDPNILSVAHALGDELGTLGIGTLVAAFDPGTFARGLATHEYTTILATDDSVPSSYKLILPLYTPVIPYIGDERVHIPTLSPSPRLRYGDARNWYTRTDRVWTWFTKKQ